MGSDANIGGTLKDWRGRSDFIAVLSLNTEKEELSIVSIPRDTLVYIEKNKPKQRVNAANAIGGYKLSRKIISNLLQLDIDNVIVFSITGAIKLVDTLGEIEIEVPKRMSYHDNSANLHIEIKPGLQKMDGRELMNFLRYRSDEMGDIGRINRQQIFFNAALKKVAEKETFFKMPELINKANEVFLTDMNFQELFSYGLFFKSLPRSKMQTYVVPGNFGENGEWLVQKDNLELLMQEIKGVRN